MFRKVLFCSFTTKKNRLYKICTNINYMSRIITDAIGALNYNFISGLWVILSGIFSAPGTFLAIKNGLRTSIAFGSS